MAIQSVIVAQRSLNVTHDKVTFNFGLSSIGDVTAGVGVTPLYTVKFAGSPFVANATAAVPSATGPVYINARYSKDGGATWHWLLTDTTAHRLAIPTNGKVSPQRVVADFIPVTLDVNDLVQGVIRPGSAEDARLVYAVFKW